MAEDPIKFCEDILKKVSRSFALTIPMLDEKIRRPVMIIYLQDRLLDNFEDEVEGITLKERRYLMDRVEEIFDPKKSGEKSAQFIEKKADLFSNRDLKRLTANASLLYRGYLTLETEVRQISFKWLKEMNLGMQEFFQRDVETFSDLNRYCYYVAGTVGGFLTDLIIEKSDLSAEKSRILRDNFEDAGLFLQKVNLIRDIKKDIENRNKNYWPLKELKIEEEMILDKRYKKEMQEALSKMLADVESHIGGLISYMENIPEEFSGYRKFFAINNGLGLATLEKIKENSDKLFYGDERVKVAKLKFLKITSLPERTFYKRAEEFLKS